MKTINLFLKAHFTSLSPDGQFISLAIIANVPKLYYSVDVGLRGDNESSDSFSKRAINENLGRPIDAFEEKSFYAEFSDFDINRCDDWVKENVISKLLDLDPKDHAYKGKGNSADFSATGNSEQIASYLRIWIKQMFPDYKINFVVDCGWFCWGKFVELIGEWETKDVRASGIADFDPFKVGLPKLPANFPPVPQDLNDLIALRRGISVSEAFELDRELLGLGFIDNEVRKGINKFKEDELAAFGFKREKISDGKFNALWDAKVTKAIYEKFI